jgi:hypothetical protein
MGLDTKIYWLTDWLTGRQSQRDFNFEPDSNDLRTEAGESSLLRPVTRKQLVKAN